MTPIGHSPLGIRLLSFSYAALIIACSGASVWGQTDKTEATNNNWREQVVGTILGPTCTRLDGQALNEPTPPTAHELVILIQKQGAQTFRLPDDWQLMLAEFEHIQSWTEPERHYPLIGPAQLEHSLYECTVRYHSQGIVESQKFVIDHNRFIMNPGGGFEPDNAEKPTDDWKRLPEGATRRLRSYPKLRSYDDIIDMPAAHDTSWPDFFQGGWVSKIDWVVDANGEKRQLSNTASSIILVRGNHLFLYHSADAYLCVYELSACDTKLNGDSRQVCLTRSNGDRRILEISEKELVFLSHGEYSMMGFSLSKLDPEFVEDTFQDLVRRTAFLLDGKIVRFCGEDVMELQTPLDYARDGNAIHKLHLPLDNPDIKRVIWFSGSASQEALMRKELFE